MQNINIYDDKILIIDFGSQYTQLIARRVREIGVYCEICSHSISDNFIKKFAPKGIIISGGPKNISKDDIDFIPELIFKLKIPILGICYGMQIMAKQLGGLVISSTVAEYGFATVRMHAHSKLFIDIADNINDKGHGMLDVWMSHGLEVNKVPNNFKCIASSNNCAVVAMADEEKKYYGLQFHPEVTHTKQGKKIISRFILDICHCNANWNTNNIVDTLKNNIKSQVKDNKILLALSGGVDSSVLATLLHLVIGDKLICIFVDNGLLRLNEGDEVMRTFADNMGINVIRINAQKRFFNVLKNITDPEQKRKIIGNEFIAIFSEEAKKITKVEFLAQGTIYPDVIESSAGSNDAKVIKSHHNVGGLPKKIGFTLVEPLKELFKDEVKKIGLYLRLTKKILYRHPFPGPGLGVRILGEVTTKYADILRIADNIFITALKKNNLYDKVSQAFVVFLPIKSVGVVGDQRRYGYVVSLRAVVTIDFMTATWSRLPDDFLDSVATDIINKSPEISRVVYDISSKPPATIEWE